MAAGDLSPQPRPKWRSRVNVEASDWNWSQDMVSPVGTAAPAAWNWSVLANTTYDCSSVGSA